MIEPDTIKELESYNNSKYSILSVYLGSDSLQAPSKDILLPQFHSLLHQNLTKTQREMFEFDISRIEDYLNNYAPSANSLIFFSAGEKLWKVVNLYYPIPNRMTIDSSPDITPIIKSQNKYSRYLVLMVDREKARMFTVEQGEILEHEDFKKGYVPQRKKMTGHDNNTDSLTMLRRTENYLDKHIDRVSQEVAKFVKAKDLDFIIIGGHQQLFNRVINSLPADFQSKIAGTFVSELNVPLNDILIESKKIAEVS